MTKASKGKEKANVRFAPSSIQRPTLDDFEVIGKIRWFRTPKLYLHMIENHQHLKDGVPEEQEPLGLNELPLRPINPSSSKLNEMTQIESGIRINRPISLIEESETESLHSPRSTTVCEEMAANGLSLPESSLSEDKPKISHPAHVFSSSPSTEHERTMSSRTERSSKTKFNEPRKPSGAGETREAECSDEHDSIALRLENMRDFSPVEIPTNLHSVPIDQLRKLYNRNQRNVRIESLVQWYSAALMTMFVIVDVASENMVGINMDKYVDLQAKNMIHYRHHLYRIADSQVKSVSSGKGAIATVEQNPYVAIIVLFGITTIGFLAMRMVLRSRSNKLFSYLMPLLGPIGSASSIGQQASTRPEFSTFSFMRDLATTMSSNAPTPPASSPQQPSMPMPSEFASRAST